MAVNEGVNKISKLKQTWIGCRMLGDAMLAAAIAAVSGSVFYYVFDLPAWWALLIFITISGTLSLIRRPWKVTFGTICSFLNITYPEVEESSALFIKPAASLNTLEQLQRDRIAYALTAVPSLPKQFTKPVRSAGLAFAVALILSFIISALPYNRYAARDKLLKTTGGNVLPEVMPAQIKSVSIKITPPAYTKTPGRVQDRFTIEAEEGAKISWTIQTGPVTKSVFLLFNEKEKLPLTSINNDKTEWAAQKIITQPGFYQLSIDGKLSALYQIQVVRDSLPVIHIITPGQYTHIDAGETQKVNVTAALSDDYGITGALIFATVAKGSGEAVKFKDYKINFAASFGQHNRGYHVQKYIDLHSMGMEPGDELYFYIEAQDNHQQKSRTDVYIVSIQDTAQLLSMDGLITGSSIKPEYFRSERQITLETEALLKDRDSISREAFQTRCNDLGIDQKMLRLRYGKFLGEEDESGSGQGSDELSRVENFSNAKAIMDVYTDKHDNAEDATFLEPAVKAQLKATLTEMWKAELQLRLYKPETALPFEYKSLRLLKDLQQKSRSYVAKTAYNPAPLKLEKRLSGDLSKIIQPNNQQKIPAPADQFETLKRAIIVLEQLKYTASLDNTGKRTLQQASLQLSAGAAARPAVYLPALSAIRHLLLSGKKANAADISVVEKAIQRILPEGAILPSRGQTAADMGLANAYYQHLNHLNR
jgi:hypothetical protein